MEYRYDRKRKIDEKQDKASRPLNIPNKYFRRGLMAKLAGATRFKNMPLR
jgi:hypothetical protein